MPYERKTKDEWQLWSNYCYGWEHELSEDTWKDIREQLKCYRVKFNLMCCLCSLAYEMN